MDGNSALTNYFSFITQWFIPDLELNYFYKSDSTFLIYPENSSEGNKDKVCGGGEIIDWILKNILLCNADNRVYPVPFLDKVIKFHFIYIFSVNISKKFPPATTLYTTRTANSILNSLVINL